MCAPRVKAAAAELVTALCEARTCLAAAHVALKWCYPCGWLAVRFRGA